MENSNIFNGVDTKDTLKELSIAFLENISRELFVYDLDEFDTEVIDIIQYLKYNKGSKPRVNKFITELSDSNDAFTEGSANFYKSYTLCLRYLEDLFTESSDSDINIVNNRDESNIKDDYCYIYSGILYFKKSVASKIDFILEKLESSSRSRDSEISINNDEYFFCPINEIDDTDNLRKLPDVEILQLLTSGVSLTNQVPFSGIITRKKLSEYKHFGYEIPNPEINKKLQYMFDVYKHVYTKWSWYQSQGDLIDKRSIYNSEFNLEKKVKVLSCSSANDIEDTVNSWIEDHKGVYTVLDQDITYGARKFVIMLTITSDINK